MQTTLPVYQTQLMGQRLRYINNTIAIGSGKGGVGKSTVAVNLAVALASSGMRVGLLDADIYGPSIPLMMGVEATVDVSEGRYQPIMAHGVQTMSIAYIAALRQALMWRGPMLAKALIQMIDQTAWDALDILLIDLPPGTGDIQLSLVQKIPLTGAVVVSTPQSVATLDADKSIQLFQRMNVQVFGLVENMAGHVCTQCGHSEDVFGRAGVAQLAARYDVPLLGAVPLDAMFCERGESGQPSALSPTQQPLWQGIAEQLVVELKKRPILSTT